MISFFVPGVPVAKGSAKAFYSKKLGRAMVVQTNRDKQKPWASMIGYEAQQAGCKITNDPVNLSCVFTMPRPKNHFGTGKNQSSLKISAPMYHTSKPDLDKLIRCVKDALTGVAWRDDSQVCELEANKLYGQMCGVYLTITVLDGKLSSVCREADSGVVPI